MRRFRIDGSAFFVALRLPPAGEPYEVPDMTRNLLFAVAVAMAAAPWTGAAAQDDRT